MITDTELALKAKAVGSAPIKDALGRDIALRWGQADPRKTSKGNPSDLKYEAETNVSVELISDTDNPALMRFPVEIGSPVNLNGRPSFRKNPHPEARILTFMVQIRSEGKLAQGNVTTVRRDFAKRWKHKSHLAVSVDIYKDDRKFTIQGQILLSTATLNRPDGLVRRAFSYDLVYTVESWILFPDERRDVAAAAEINIEFKDQDTGDDLGKTSIPST